MLKTRFSKVSCLVLDIGTCEAEPKRPGEKPDEKSRTAKRATIQQRERVHMLDRNVRFLDRAGRPGNPALDLRFAIGHGRAAQDRFSALPSIRNSQFANSPFT